MPAVYFFPVATKGAIPVHAIARARRAAFRPALRPKRTGRPCRAPGSERLPYLLAGDAHGLFQADDARFSPAHRVLSQRLHAAADRMRAQRLLRGAVMDQAAQLVVDVEQFIDAGAAAIAGAVASRTAYGGVIGFAVLRKRLAAFQAKTSHQALRADADQARGEQERLDAHVDEPRHRAHRVVRVQR